MLRSCTEQEFKQYADFVYELALDPSRSSYPAYTDGIKTKEMFLERAQSAFSKATEEILLFEYEETVEGWIHYYFIPEDHYLSAVTFNIQTHMKQALQEFLEFVQIRFKGYELYLGFPTDNKNAVDFLSNHEFECIEDDFNNTAFLEKYEPIPISDSVILITKENFNYFRTLHRTFEQDMYWNSDRIYAALDKWIIFVKLRQDEVLGSVYLIDCDDDWFEIFGIDMKDEIFDSEVFYELLGKALNTAKERNGKYMTFFCEKEQLEIVKKLGFQCIGEYVCYKKLIE